MYKMKMKKASTHNKLVKKMRLSYEFKTESEKYETHNDYHFGCCCYFWCCTQIGWREKTQTNEEIIFFFHVYVLWDWVSECGRIAICLAPVWLNEYFVLYFPILCVFVCVWEFQKSCYCQCCCSFYCLLAGAAVLFLVCMAVFFLFLFLMVKCRWQRETIFKNTYGHRHMRAT